MRVQQTRDGGRRANKRGYILLTMGAAAVALFGALGLAVDVGRMFIAKSETQAFCDSAALAATLKLDGTTTGITAARNAVANSVNAWNLDSIRVTDATSQPLASYQVDFATTASGPWASNPGPASGYVYARVRVTAPVGLYFIPVVVPQTQQNVTAAAIAGQIAQTALPRGLGPFSAIGPNPADTTNFGLVPGSQYDIQWPAYNGTRAGCSPLTPDLCFVQPTCSGESATAKAEVVTNWGASVNGFWGSNANSTINGEVLDAIQLQPVQVGGDIMMSSGNKNAEATALDTRVNQDGDVEDNTPNGYLASATENGRRLIALPIVTAINNGGNAEGYVLGYGSFLLISNANGGHGSNYYASGNGNDPFCAVYVGSGYVQGGGPGGGGTAGYFKVKLVQ
jgi:Flp pilus assembly protein TadG